MKRMIALVTLVTLFIGCASLGSIFESSGRGQSGRGNAAGEGQGSGWTSGGTSPGNSSRNDETRVKTPLRAPERAETSKTEAELVAEAIRWGDCAFLYEYTQREGADRQLVTQANNTIRRYTSLDGGTGKYLTNKMEARVRRVPRELAEQVFVDPEAALPGTVSSLTNGISDQFLKVKILHDWICDNIAYDTEMYFTGRVSAQDYSHLRTPQQRNIEGASWAERKGTTVTFDFEIPAGITELALYGSKDGRQYTGLLNYVVAQ